MKWYLVFLLMSFSWFIGYVWGAFMTMAKRKVRTVDEIVEAREEIIQVAIDHCGCSHRTEGDADYDIDGIGTGKIQKILSELL